MYPHERTLVEEMSGRPFALLGVNNDGKISRVKDAIKKTFISKGEKVVQMINLYSPNGLWVKRNASNQKVLDAAFEAVEQELAVDQRPGDVDQLHRPIQLQAVWIAGDGERLGGRPSSPKSLT